MKLSNPVHCLLALLIVAVSSSTYGAIYNGTGPGESTIGTGGDYPSLNSACQAINSQPLTGGDWTFLILNDLSEPANPSIMQSELNGHGITLRPAPGTSSTVTFTTTSMQNLIRTHGHLTIGALVYRPAGGSTTRAFASTHNITIDGCNTPGGTERNLTFKNVAGIGARTIIAVQGDCDHIAIKNCSLEANGVYLDGSVYDRRTAGIDFVPRIQTVLEAPDEVADFPTVQNCRLLYTHTEPAIGIAINWTQQPSVPKIWSSLVTITENEIVGFSTGIKSGFTSSSLVSDNFIEVNAALSSPNQTAKGVFSLIDADLRVQNNKIIFSDIVAAGNGLQGILQRGDPYTSITATIQNNMISGLTAPSSTIHEGALTRHGIQIDTLHGSTTTLYQNSIEMSQANGSQLNHADCFSIYHGHLNGGGGVGQLILKNNILRMTIRGGGIISSNGTSASITSNHNNIYIGSNSRVGYGNLQYFSTLNAWQQGTGSDLNSISQDPYIAAGPGFGTWIGPEGSGNADLHFTSYPGPAYLAPPIDGVSHDIDGDVRNATAVVMGADEIVHPNAAVGEWALY